MQRRPPTAAEMGLQLQALARAGADEVVVGSFLCQMTGSQLDDSLLLSSTGQAVLALTRTPAPLEVLGAFALGLLSSRAILGQSPAAAGAVTAPFGAVTAPIGTERPSSEELESLVDRLVDEKLSRPRIKTKDQLYVTRKLLLHTGQTTSVSIGRRLLAEYTNHLGRPALHRLMKRFAGDVLPQTRSGLIQAEMRREVAEHKKLLIQKPSLKVV